jgi:glycerol kinase
MAKLVMALDQGTTSSRTIIFDEHAQIVSKAQEAFDCLYPKAGWVEQNPYDLWHSQQKTMKEALASANLTMADIHCIGITNQRETTVAWNKETGEALGKAIVWQCRRTADFCDVLKAEGFDKIISERTGLVTDAYFSGTKMRWILKNNPEAKALADKGKLAFGTVDSWLIWNLTGHKVHKIDASNASRTMIYDIHKNCWDEEILARFEIPLNTLPEVCPSSGIVGETDPSLFKGSAPISGIAGDQQAALFGQACFKRGMAKNTYGTGCFLLMNTGEKTVKSNNGLLTTIAWQKDGKTTYALEGAVFIGGALMQWLRDGLELFEDASETEAMATMVPSADGVYVVPAFVGLGAPHWDPYARGTIVGLTRDTTKNHIVRASLKAIAFQCYDVLKAMETDLGETLSTLRIDGGASMNSFLCQFQADILGCKVTRPSCVETTAMGAAFLAGLATKVWKSEEEIAKLWDIDTIFEAQRPAQKVAEEIETWHRAVERSRGWIIER